jgi:hypothetical protein
LHVKNETSQITNQPPLVHYKEELIHSAPSFQGTDHFIFMGICFLKQNGVVVNFS